MVLESEEKSQNEGVGSVCTCVCMKLGPALPLVMVKVTSDFLNV